MKKSARIAVIALSILTVLFVFKYQSHRTQIMGPLKMLPSNPRYFTDGTGKPVYLTGSHTWESLQDNAGHVFDYTAYVNFMAARNHNFMRMWAYEKGENTSYYEPTVYVQLPCGKYDTTQFNQAYFDRLRSRVIEAGNKGIYVSIMLFQGWSIYNHGYGNPWPLHAYHAANNINGINGDVNGDGQGREVHSLAVPAITQLQEKYVQKVIDTVNDLNNVLYEITNESPFGSLDWQNYLAAYIKKYEAAKPKQHPVGITAFDGAPPGSMRGMLSSQADWISPENDGSADYVGDPPAGTGAKVIITDNDHLGNIDGHAWVWRSFMRGLNVIYMDDTSNNWGVAPARDDIRNALGHTRTYANRLNLAAVSPRGDLTSTRYALANPGSEYLVYQPGTSSFTVNVQAGAYQVEWFNASNGQTSSGGSMTMSSGGSCSFTPPFAGDAVLYLSYGGGGHRRGAAPAEGSVGPRPCLALCNRTFSGDRS